MPRFSYRSVQVLIYDPVAEHRAVTRSLLLALGFRDIRAVSSAETFAEALKRGRPDLVLAEILRGNSDVCSHLQSLREGIGWHNPFIVIIATAWEKSSTLVGRIICSGADDLLLRPFSAGVLESRIQSQIARRKSFVITSEYVGPDRRQDPARQTAAATFDPPNSLRLKALEELSPKATEARLEAELVVARSTLHNEKLRRDAFQVCVLWRLLQHELGPGSDTAAQLGAVLGSIERRLTELQDDSALELCLQASRAANDLELSEDRLEAMRLLGEASLTFHSFLHPDKDGGDQIAEIDATVALIRAKQDVLRSPAVREAHSASPAAALLPATQ